MDHLVFGVVLYRELLHRDSSLHLYSNLVLGMKWRFGLFLALEEGKVSQEQQLHTNVQSRLAVPSANVLIIHHFIPVCLFFNVVPGPVTSLQVRPSTIIIYGLIITWGLHLLVATIQLLLPINSNIVRDHLVDHLVVGVVLYRGLQHRDSTLHLFSKQVLGMKWRFGLILALEEGKVSQEQQLHTNVQSRLPVP